MSVLPLRVIPASDDGPELSALVSDAREGQPDAYPRLVRRIERTVRRWAQRLTGDSDDADDVTQDVLILLERRLPQYEGRSRFSTWLYAITRNVARERLRRDARRAIHIVPERADPAAPPTAEGAVDDATITSVVLRYFDALPPRQREIFELADLRGLSPTEIAARLDMKAVTVRAHLFKARRAIREQMLLHHANLLEEFRS